jgi:hypothetical protein
MGTHTNGAHKNNIHRAKPTTQKHGCHKKFAQEKIHGNFLKQMYFNANNKNAILECFNLKNNVA